MDETNNSVNTPAAADPANAGQVANAQSADTSSAAAQTADESTLTGDPVNPGAKRDYEHDAEYARQRRDREAAEREAAAAKKASDTLRNALKTMNITGETPDEMAINAEAFATGKPREEIKAAYEKRTEAETLKSENENLKKLIRDSALNKDLIAIKAAYPEVKAENINELGEDFVSMMAAGKNLDPVKVYGALKIMNEANKKPVPKSTGDVRSSGTQEKDFFTREEVQKMTSSEVHKNYDKIIASQKKW
ncbi:hypothetical protein SDC9_124400 [bioreactor metagenome]|uniref:Uncharacterized protein n=1 Tax=bioreactor metagenome TaxID=1076179 RepID=A0A645CKC3_9ZZZZ|nr:hypothetical protein [Oscillospiraceae bacterium]